MEAWVVTLFWTKTNEDDSLLTLVISVKEGSKWGRELCVFNSFLGEQSTFCHSWLLPLTHSKDCLVPSLNYNSIFGF